MKPQSVAIVVGLFAAGWHIVWSVFVLFGIAQPLLTFIYWMHFLNNPFVVEPFDITKALVLLIVTFVVGYVVGWCFALLWNKYYSRR